MDLATLIQLSASGLSVGPKNVTSRLGVGKTITFKPANERADPRRERG